MPNHLSVTDTAHILINTATQTLQLYHGDTITCTYRISTAKNGTGQLEGSECTPLGKHIIANKFGADAQAGSVFVGRQFTGEIYNDELGQKYPDRDWILSRILWLQGLEDGYNLGKTPNGEVCDTHARYIYIHGTPDSEPLGVPMSHGCVRMHSADVIVLFTQVDIGCAVEII